MPRLSRWPPQGASADRRGRVLMGMRGPPASLYRAHRWTRCGPFGAGSPTSISRWMGGSGRATRCARRRQRVRTYLSRARPCFVLVVWAGLTWVRPSQRFGRRRWVTELEGSEMVAAAARQRPLETCLHPLPLSSDAVGDFGQHPLGPLDPRGPPDRRPATRPLSQGHRHYPRWRRRHGGGLRRGWRRSRRGR